jgi:drug/metabolite transporter (DMT)-like permease
MLLLIDVILGYSMSGYQILGITLLCGTLLLLSMNHGLDRRGIWYVILGAINAAIVTSIYKYDISHGNPVETEIFFYETTLLIFFYAMCSRLRPREHPFALLKKPMILLQSAAVAVGSLIGSYAYVFAAASVVMTADRSASVAWAVMSGRVAFKEKHLVIKIIAVIGFIGGLALLMVPR